MIYPSSKWQYDADGEVRGAASRYPSGRPDNSIVAFTENSCVALALVLQTATDLQILAKNSLACYSNFCSM